MVSSRVGDFVFAQIIGALESLLAYPTYISSQWTVHHHVRSHVIPFGRLVVATLPTADQAQVSMSLASYVTITKMIEQFLVNTKISLLGCFKDLETLRCYLCRRECLEAQGLIPFANQTHG